MLFDKKIDHYMHVVILLGRANSVELSKVFYGQPDLSGSSFV